MRQIFTLLLFIICTLNTFGQTETETVLQQQLDTATSDYSKASIYSLLLRNTKDYDKKLAYAEACLKFSKASKNDKLIANAYYYLGFVAYKEKNLSKAIAHLDNAFPIFLEMKDTSSLMQTLSLKGKSYSYIGEYDKAIENYLILLEWATSKGDINRIDRSLQSLAYAYSEMDEFETALKYAEMSYELERENNLDLSYAFDMMAGIYSYMGDYNKAKEYYCLALAKTQDERNSYNYGIGLSNIGNTYMQTGQYDSAMYYFLNFLEIAIEIEDEYAAAIAHAQIADIQLELGELSEAKKNALLAIVYYEEKDIQMDYLTTVNLLGNILLSQGEYEEVLSVVEAGLSKIKATDALAHSISFYNLLGKLYREKGEYETALNNHQKSLEYAKQVNNSAELSETCYNLAVTEKLLGNYDEAYEYAIQSLNVAKTANFRHYLNNIYKILAELAAIKKDYTAAYQYQLFFQSVQDSILNIEKNRYLIKYHTEFQVTQKDAENAILKSEQAQNQIIIKRQTLIGFGLGTVLLIIFIIAIWLFYNNRRKQRYNLKLEKTVNERTKALKIANKNLTQANLELRTFNYIASHDIKEPIRNIGSYVGLIRRKLPKDLKESLNEYFDIIKRSTSQLYTLIEDFAHYTSMSKNEVLEKQETNLDELSMLITEQLRERLQSNNGQVLTSQLPTIQSNNSLLFTTLKNLVENGLKYNKSEKPTVSIDYNKTKKYHKIIVSDNGIGIEKQYHEQIFEMFKRLHNRAAYEGSGIGLAIVKLSVEKLGGTIKLESEVSKGSRFIIELPH